MPVALCLYAKFFTSELRITVSVSLKDKRQIKCEGELKWIKSRIINVFSTQKKQKIIQIQKPLNEYLNVNLRIYLLNTHKRKMDTNTDTDAQTSQAPPCSPCPPPTHIHKHTDTHCFDHQVICMTMKGWCVSSALLLQPEISPGTPARAECHSPSISLSCTFLCQWQGRCCAFLTHSVKTRQPPLKQIEMSRTLHFQDHDLHSRLLHRKPRHISNYVDHCMIKCDYISHWGSTDWVRLVLSSRPYVRKSVLVQQHTVSNLC